MTALLLLEVHRMLSRRLVRLFGGLAVLGIVVAGVWVFVWASGRPDPAGADGPFRLVSVVEVLQGTSVPLVLLAWLLGASFIGAEWHHHTVATTLTWEPRRSRVIGAKVAAAVLVTFAGALVLQALLAAALVPAALFQGTTAGAGSGWLGELAGVGFRAAALAAVAAVLGFGAASIGRNTAAALGVGFAYLAIVENLLGSLRPAWRPWLLIGNSIVFVSGREQFEIAGRSVTEAGALLALYAAAVFLVAAVMFRRRDVV
jgi:ABC-type transport system involved in multi-copper enzyme maturation permease subunit